MTTVDNSIEDALTSPDFGPNPYPAYHLLLELEQPYWSEAWGVWLISGFDDVVAYFRDWEHFSNAGRLAAQLEHLAPDELGHLEPLQRYAAVPGIIHSDPPDHSRLRKLFTRAFTNRVVEQMRSDIEALVAALLDSVQGNGSLDVVADLAQPLPAIVISELLGVPAEDRDLFIEWSDAVIAFQGSRRPLEVALEAQRGYVSLQNYMIELIRDRRINPRHSQDREDLLTGLVEAADGTGLPEDNLAKTCVTLLIGGHETTTSLITNTLLLLMTNPDQMVELRSSPELMASTIEESLRCESPVQIVARRVTKDIECRGQALKEGDLALLMVGAANRDSTKFDSPDRFDIRRNSRHMAFGYGIHFCVGAPLARLEAPIAIQSILTRMPGLRLLGEAIPWSVHKPSGRGPLALNVVF